MFFPELVKSISSSDKVLEIGPGATPHPRSDIFLELKLEKEEDYAKQFGHERKLETQKKIVFYDGKKFPFADKEFDYVICSHVLEHVPDVEGFVAEVFRVSKKGYFEYPLITYEYLYNFDVHLNYLRWDGQKLWYMKKEGTGLNQFEPVQKFFRETLTQNHDTFIKKIPEFFIQGFEWEKPFTAECTNVIEKFIPEKNVPGLTWRPENDYSFGELFKAMMKKIKRKCLGS